ncbi:histidine phosphatase family protein [Leifsonia sp. YAF41]|uniref:histidine phosphatase family protein n=1 Tax=Leifsonia sp. YAF41 TaxID=3233086 RepID=UPI003F99C10E
MKSRRTLRVAIAGIAAAAMLFSFSAFSAPIAESAKATITRAGNENNGKNAEVDIYLTRHGKTWLNETGRMQGWSDSPLTESGVLDAEHLGRGLAKADVKFKSAYSADMLRHFQTISLALGELGYKDEAVRDERLREVSFGKFEGATQAEVLTAVKPYLTGGDPKAFLAAIVKANGTSALPAETYQQVGARATAALNDIAAAQAKKGGGNVLVVSSGITIMAVLDTLGADTSSLTAGIENAAVSKLVYKNGTWTVVSMNDKSYVEAGAE